ncbi:hypothetical protein FA15DRAFT_696652 [Coprinopsis marcescibilis]|uniref:Uncharacterized protein n=1 Tax=Coprinopsis marcescibilis TaxID=230819 RepID=A0A5C3KYA2_COPMA|nr:hypothetical protein FA15DRAFT_696652 [Coprinopsis marcescibilis]
MDMGSLDNLKVEPRGAGVPAELTFNQTERAIKMRSYKGASLLSFASPPSKSTSVSTTATTGSVYLAGFAQAEQPHVALIRAIDYQKGYIFHITTKKTDIWHYEGNQAYKIAGSMTLTSLYCIYDAQKAGAEFDCTTLDDICKAVAVPEGAEMGECVIWANKALAAIAEAHPDTIILSGNVDATMEHFLNFVEGNRAYASRTKYPNLDVRA